MGPASLNLPVAVVDPADVQAIWRILNLVSPSLSGSFKKEGSAETGSNAVSFDYDLLAGHCSVGADVYAVFLRVMLLSFMLRSGLLAPWQDGAELSAAVFQAAATVPIARLAGFDPDEFIALLPDASGPRQPS